MTESPPWSKFSLVTMFVLTAIAALAAGIYANWENGSPGVLLALIGFGAVYLLLSLCRWAVRIFFKAEDHLQ